MRHNKHNTAHGPTQRKLGSCGLRRRPGASFFHSPTTQTRPYTVYTKDNRCKNSCNNRSTTRQTCASIVGRRRVQVRAKNDFRPSYRKRRAAHCPAFAKMWCPHLQKSVRALVTPRRLPIYPTYPLLIGTTLKEPKASPRTHPCPLRLDPYPYGQVVDPQQCL